MAGAVRRQRGEPQHREVQREVSKMENKITEKFLRKVRACEEGIDFLRRNSLDGYPFSEVPKIKGDYKQYINSLYSIIPEKVFLLHNKKGEMVGERFLFPYGSVMEIDSEGNLTYVRQENGREIWREYDSKGNEIILRDSFGLLVLKEYDQSGLEVHTIRKGLEVWREYDSCGREVCYRDSKGLEYFKKYDQRGNEVHYKRSDGLEIWREYDSKGREVNVKGSTGYEAFMEYDSEGNMTRYRDSYGEDYLREYDCFGNQTFFKRNGSIERRNKFVQLQGKNHNGLIVKTLLNGRWEDTLIIPEG
jgi:hypothetical protein